MEMERLTYSVKEAAEVLGLSPESIRKWKSMEYCPGSKRSLAASDSAAATCWPALTWLTRMCGPARSGSCRQTWPGNGPKTSGSGSDSGS